MQRIKERSDFPSQNFFSINPGNTFDNSKGAPIISCIQKVIGQPSPVTILKGGEALAAGQKARSFQTRKSNHEGKPVMKNEVSEWG